MKGNGTAEGLVRSGINGGFGVLDGAGIDRLAPELEPKPNHAGENQCDGKDREHALSALALTYFFGGDGIFGQVNSPFGRRVFEVAVSGERLGTCFVPIAGRQERFKGMGSGSAVRLHEGI
jgi:hypothetical protein